MIYRWKLRQGPRAPSSDGAQTELNLIKHIYYGQFPPENTPVENNLVAKRVTQWFPSNTRELNNSASKRWS